MVRLWSDSWSWNEFTPLPTPKYTCPYTHSRGMPERALLTTCNADTWISRYPAGMEESKKGRSYSHDMQMQEIWSDTSKRYLDRVMPYRVRFWFDVHYKAQLLRSPDSITLSELELNVLMQKLYGMSSSRSKSDEQSYDEQSHQLTGLIGMAERPIPRAAGSVVSAHNQPVKLGPSEVLRLAQRDSEGVVVADTVAVAVASPQASQLSSEGQAQAACSAWFRTIAGQHEAKHRMAFMDLTEHSSNPLDNPSENLQVRLHDYQLQAYRFLDALEQHPGSVNAAFWIRLPFYGAANTIRASFYYSPFFQRFHFGHLPDIRGGWNCQAMGLGKTIVSLALINRTVSSNNSSSSRVVVVAAVCCLLKLCPIQTRLQHSTIASAKCQYKSVAMDHQILLRP